MANARGGTITRRLFSFLGGAVLITGFVGAASCGTTTPSVIQLAGTWNGNEIDTVAGTGVLQSILTQNGTSLSGTYSVSFTNTVFSNSGSLSGSINGTTVTLTATPSNPLICSATDTGTVNSAGTSITGNYAAVSSCALAHQAGSFSATKQ